MSEKISVLMVNNSITSKTKHMRRKQNDTDRFSENYKELKISVYHAQKTYQHIKKKQINSDIEKQKDNKFSRN